MLVFVEGGNLHGGNQQQPIYDQSRTQTTLAAGEPVFQIREGSQAGLEVNFLVYLQSFASKIFFCWQTGEITSKFLPNVW